MNVGVLVNPMSRRNRLRRNRLEEILAGRPDVIFERTQRLEDLPDVLDDFIRRDVRAILISGGDGTVQAVQTHLAETQPAGRLPRLALLPDGTTNMNAADVGVHNPRSRTILERLSVAEYCVRSTNIKRRRTVRIDNPGEGGPRHGMFLGLGAIERAVAMCHRDAHSIGLAGNWASGATLLQALFGSVARRGDGGDPRRIYQGTAIDISADGDDFCVGEQFAVLATTLHRLILASRPFWNQSADALRLTSASFPPPRLVRSLFTVMYGGGLRSRLDDAYRSRSAATLEIVSASPGILDGEVIAPPKEGPMKVSLGPTFEYLCG